MMKNSYDVRWYHFWHPYSGLAGGLISGVLIGLVYVLAFGWWW